MHVKRDPCMHATNSTSLSTSERRRKNERRREGGDVGDHGFNPYIPQWHRVNIYKVYNIERGEKIRFRTQGTTLVVLRTYH